MERKKFSLEEIYAQPQRVVLSIKTRRQFSPLQSVECLRRKGSAASVAPAARVTVPRRRSAPTAASAGGFEGQPQPQRPYAKFNPGSASNFCTPNDIEAFRAVCALILEAVAAAPAAAAIVVPAPATRAATPDVCVRYATEATAQFNRTSIPGSFKGADNNCTAAMIGTTADA